MARTPELTIAQKIKYQIYRWFMRLAHRHNWHHTETIYPDGDTQHWCQWCGLRQTLKRDSFFGHKLALSDSQPRNTVTFFNPDDFKVTR